MVRVCQFLQNWCCCYLQSNRLCDKLCPTTIDGNVLGQISQPILSRVSYFGMGFFTFGCIAQLVLEHTTFNRVVVGSNPTTPITSALLQKINVKGMNYYNTYYTERIRRFAEVRVYIWWLRGFA